MFRILLMSCFYYKTTELLSRMQSHCKSENYISRLLKNSIKNSQLVNDFHAYILTNRDENFLRYYLSVNSSAIKMD